MENFDKLLKSPEVSTVKLVCIKVKSLASHFGLFQFLFVIQFIIIGSAYAMPNPTATVDDGTTTDGKHCNKFTKKCENNVPEDERAKRCFQPDDCNNITPVYKYCEYGKCKLSYTENKTQVDCYGQQEGFCANLRCNGENQCVSGGKIAGVDGNTCSVHTECKYKFLRCNHGKCQLSESDNGIDCQGKDDDFCENLRCNDEKKCVVGGIRLGVPGNQCRVDEECTRTKYLRCNEGTCEFSDETEGVDCSGQNADFCNYVRCNDQGKCVPNGTVAGVLGMVCSTDDYCESVRGFCELTATGNSRKCIRETSSTRKGHIECVPPEVVREGSPSPATSCDELPKGVCVLGENGYKCKDLPNEELAFGVSCVSDDACDFLNKACYNDGYSSKCIAIEECRKNVSLANHKLEEQCSVPCDKEIGQPCDGRLNPSQCNLGKCVENPKGEGPYECFYENNCKKEALTCASGGTCSIYGAGYIPCTGSDPDECNVGHPTCINGECEVNEGGKPGVRCHHIGKDPICDKVKNSNLGANRSSNNSQIEIKESIERYHELASSSEGISPASIIGSPTAGIQLVAFLDPSCGQCARLFGREDLLANLKPLIDKGLVGVSIFSFPLIQISKAEYALRCAGEQGKYSEFLNSYSKNFKDFYTMLNKQDVQNPFGGAVKQLALSQAAFNSCMANSKQSYDPEIESSKLLGKILGVEGTPSIFLANHGRRTLMEVPNSVQEIVTAVNDALLKQGKKP